MKRKDFAVAAALSDEQVLARDFERQLIAGFRRLAPLMDWLCGALDLEF